jgi:polar amino acid transport system permease protein
MSTKSIAISTARPRLNTAGQRLKSRLARFPWWLAGVAILALGIVWLVLTQPAYSEAFNLIKAGLSVTLSITLVAFLVALVVGLVTSLARLSSNVLIKNVAIFYIEVIRGVPMLVLIFFIALVAVPGVVNLLNTLGQSMAGRAPLLAGPLLALKNNSVSMELRAVIALATTYGAFLAEIFRAGIESIGRGQMEAARSQGMSYGQAMRFIILPQAVRNILPALGNDFVSMLKDSSLVSVLAVRDVTQIARLFAGRSFQFQEAYTLLAFTYLSMTLLLSLLVKYFEKRLNAHGRA